MVVARTTLSAISHFRKQFLKENNIQFVFDKCHRYGWADTYALSDGDKHVGYGSVWGRDKREDRDAIFEFYLIEDYRHRAEEFFRNLCVVSKAPFIECQSNDRFLFPMFEKFAVNVFTEAILFEDKQQTNLQATNVFLKLKEQSNPDDRQYILINEGSPAGSGGFMLNYNFPYADIYYEINEPHRRRGLGSYFVQELKKEIYGMGRVPAARCNATNTISKATLMKAGMAICGLRVNGDIKMD